MPLPLLPILVVALTGATYYKARSRNVPGKGELTPERQAIYEVAMRELQDPAKLRKMATAFKDQGLPVQAEMLEKRASLNEMPQHVKMQRREIFKKAMKSTNREAIIKLAKAFYSQGATGAAESLYNYAQSLPLSSESTSTVPVEPIRPQNSNHKKIEDDVDPSILTEEETLQNEDEDNENVEETKPNSE